MKDSHLPTFFSTLVLLLFRFSSVMVVLVIMSLFPFFFFLSFLRFSLIYMRVYITPLYYLLVIITQLKIHDV